MKGDGRKGDGRKRAEPTATTGASRPRKSRPLWRAEPTAGRVHAALSRLRVLERGLQILATSYHCRLDPDAARQDETAWTLVGERLQAIECVLAHLGPARKALVRAFETPASELQAEFEAAQRAYARTKRRLNGDLPASEVPHEP